MTRDWHPQLTAALLQPAYWTPTVSHKVMLNSCFTSKAWIQIQINETVASCSVQHSLAAHVLRCGLNIYVWVTCTLNASLSSTADKQWKHPRRMIGSLPVCIADVWTARRFSPGTFQFTGSYLENTSAPPRASRSALRNGGCTRAPRLPRRSECFGQWQGPRGRTTSLSLRRQLFFCSARSGFSAAPRTHRQLQIPVVAHEQLGGVLSHIMLSAFYGF